LAKLEFYRANAKTIRKAKQEITRKLKTDIFLNNI
jgi:hypothetical protein